MNQDFEKDMKLDGQTRLLCPFPKTQGSMESKQVDIVVFHSIYPKPLASGPERDGKLTVNSVKVLTQVTAELRLARLVRVHAVAHRPASKLKEGR